MIKEFKAFISRGNVIDLAVGIIIGAAFSAIVASLVADVVMPVVSLLTGGIKFTSLKIPLGPGDNAAAINYGNFIQAVVNFLIIALVVFFIVKAINRFRKPKKEEPAPAPVVPREEVLLEEIRDLLKEKR